MCLVLTPTGTDYARKFFQPQGSDVPETGIGEANDKLADLTRLRLKTAVPSDEVTSPKRDVLTPTWDPLRRQLRLGRDVVKHYKLPSPNQERILCAFEEDEWPARVDDPLPPTPTKDPKIRLHNTIKGLNRNQRLRLIRFRGDGHGEGVLWDLVEAEEVE